MALFRRRRDNVEHVAAAVAEHLKATLPGLGALPAGAQVMSTEQATAMVLASGQAAVLPRNPVWGGVAFGPGQPINPSAIDPAQGDGMPALPRRWQYPVSWNLQGADSRTVPFQVLRDIGDQCDIARRCIEVRKAEIASLDWDFTVSDQAVGRVMAQDGIQDQREAGRLLRERFSGQMAALRDWWETPDRVGQFSMADWLLALLEDHLVVDAVAVYPHWTLDARTVHSFELLDPTTIKPLLDERGGVPQPPLPAFQQILYGFPRGEFTASELPDDEYDQSQLAYWVRNRRVHTPYGMSPIEQNLPALDLWLKRQEWVRSEYSDGVTPEMLLEIQNDWTPDQLATYERIFNEDLAGQTQLRHRARFLPSGAKAIQTASFAERYSSEYDEYLIKLICAGFDVLPSRIGFTPKGGLGGRGHQEGEASSEHRKGIVPTAKNVTALINRLCRLYLGMPAEITFSFLDLEAEDQDVVAKTRDMELRNGSRTLNEVRAERGDAPYDFDEADMPFVVAGTQVLFMEGSSVDEEPIVAPDADGSNTPGAAPAGTPPAPGNDPAGAVDDTAKAAEVAAFKRWTRKPRARDFVWKHHTADEVKVLTAGKAQAPERGLHDRLVSFYAPLIRQALRSQADPMRIAAAALGEQLKAVQRTDLGVELVDDTLGETVVRLVQDGWLAGAHAGAVRVGADASSLTGSIDWDVWQPGNPSLAHRMLGDGDPLNLARLLDRAGVTIRGIDDTTMDRINRAVADAIASGDSVDTLAGALGDVLDDPDRAFLIANTETARAMTAGALDTYAANGVEQFDVLVFDPCEICAEQAADNPHPLSDDAPPYHPACRCAAAPVVASVEGAPE